MGKTAIRALVELFGPAGVVAREILVARGDGDGRVHDCTERSVGACAERDALDGHRAVAESIHLPPGQHDTNRSLEFERCKRSQHHLMLRPQSGPEGASDIGRDHADIIRLLAKHTAQKVVDVLDPLRLVIDCEPAVAVPDDGACIELHRIVMLRREDVIRLVPHCGHRQRRRGVAARLMRPIHLGCLATLGLEIRRKRLLIVFDTHSGRGEFGSLPILRDDERDWLAVESDHVVIERAERRALLRRHLVLPGIVIVGQARPMRMGEDVDDALDFQRLAGVQASDAPARNRGFDHEAMDEVIRCEFAGIFGGTGDFGPAVDTRRWCSNIGVHRSLTRFSCEPAIAVWRLRPAPASARWRGARARS